MADRKPTILVNPVTGYPFKAIPDEVPQPVFVWETTDDGKRRPGTTQDTLNGVPLWEATVIIPQINFGRTEHNMVILRWAAAEPQTVIPGMTAPSAAGRRGE